MKSAEISDVVNILEESPEFLQREVDIRWILDDDQIKKQVAKSAILIFEEKTKLNKTADPKEDMLKAMRYAGNCLVGYIVSKSLIEEYPLMEVNVPGQKTKKQRTTEHPSAAFSVVGFNPYLCHITAEGIDETRYFELIKGCYQKAGKYALSMAKNQQIPAGGSVGAVFHCMKLEDVGPNTYFKAGFGKSLSTSKKLGELLTGNISLKCEGGISAAAVKKVMCDFIKRYEEGKIIIKI